MVSKVFLDANILLDSALHRANHLSAEKVIDSVITGQFRGYITPSVVHTVDYWLSKSFGKTKSKQIIIALLRDIKVIDCDHPTALRALHSHITDIEDALQYYAAVEHGLDCFITLDKKLHKSAIPTLPVYFPQEFVNDFLM